MQFVQDDLSDIQCKTKLGKILKKGGGKYHGASDSHNSLMFNIYTDIKFTLLVPNCQGILTSLTVKMPLGRACSVQGGVHAAFWNGMSGKCLIQGGLVALVWKSDTGISVHLGTIVSSLKELTEHIQGNASHLKLWVVFFDIDIELCILSELRTGCPSFDGVKVLVELPVLFKAIHPFLEALKTEPEIIPLSCYLVFHPSDYFSTCTIDPPKYMWVPGFAFQLLSLFNPEAEVDDLQMSVSDWGSVDHAHTKLHWSSRLDPSQANAVITVLSRELVLIQG